MPDQRDTLHLGYTSGYASAGKFGLQDYQRMFKAKGWKLPFRYFLEAHLFDLLHGTDTHHWRPKELFPEMPENFLHGGLYMCSWTGEIKQAFRFLRKHLGEEFQNYQFIDVGCGKGKVALVWKRLAEKCRSKQPVTGIDYIPQFIDIAIRNQSIVFGRDKEPLFEVADATTYDYYKSRGKLIVYLYNPFDAIILEAVLRKIERSANIVVYNYPVHEDVLARNGYRKITSRIGFHPNAHTVIFANH
jgi:SAM-dependent methyltransferase